MILSTKELGELLGLTERHIYNLEKAGVLKKEGKNEWSAPLNVQGYINYKIESDGSSSDLGKVRIRREIAEAKLKELQYKERIGALISIGEVAKELEDIAVVVSNKLYNISRLIKTKLKIDSEAIKMLESLIDEVLSELKDPKEYELKAQELEEKAKIERVRENIEAGEDIEASKASEVSEVSGAGGAGGAGEVKRTELGAKIYKIERKKSKTQKKDNK